MFSNKLGSQEIEGFILNFAQKERYSGNYFIGLQRESNPLRTDRMEFKWHPAGAKNPEESRNLQINKPKEVCVTEYSAGEIDPQPVTFIYPDRWADLPSQLKFSKRENRPDVGAVLNKTVYQFMDMYDLMFAYLNNHPERKSEIKEAYQSSDMFDERVAQTSEIVEAIMGAVEQNRNNRG